MERRKYEHTLIIKITGETFEDILFAFMVNRAIDAANSFLERFNGGIEILHEETFIGDEEHGE